MKNYFFFVIFKVSYNFQYLEYVSPIHILAVRSDNVDDQLVEVMQFFNIRVKEENIFSRCQNCNANEFILITQKELIRINRYKIEPINQVPRHMPLKRSWIVERLTMKHERTLKTSRGVNMNIFRIPENIVRTNSNFYVCEVSYNFISSINYLIIFTFIMFVLLTLSPKQSKFDIIFHLNS